MKTKAENSIEEWQKRKLHSTITDDGTQSFFWFGLHFKLVDSNELVSQLFVENL